MLVLRSLAPVLILAVGAPLVRGAPLLDALASPCSGNGDPSQALGSIVGKCYEGVANVLTISESANIQIKAFDTSTGEGSLKIDAVGVDNVHCPPTKFTKQTGSRDITLDLNACGHIKKTVATAEYCSDQDTIRIHVKVPDSAAAGASNLPLIPVTLKPVTCKEAHAELKSAKSA